MKISDFVYLVGSDQFGLSHPLDCNCYVLDGSSELALVDTGLGLGVDEMVLHLARTGLALNDSVTSSSPIRTSAIGAAPVTRAHGSDDLGARGRRSAHGRYLARPGHPDESPFRTLPGRLHAASL